MVLERINLTTQDSKLVNTSKSKEKQQNNPIVAKALELGINVEAYYTYDENNECTGIDTVKLNAAIQEAMQTKKAQDNSKYYEADSFEITTNNTMQSKEETKTEVKNIQKDIDKEYTEAAVKYVNSLDPNASSNTKEGKLTDEWEAIKSDANKLTSFTAPNTTVLEGVKEFITTLTGLINTTKNYNAEKEDTKESSLTLETAGDIEDKNNEIEVYETNIFSSNPFKSAFETFLEEEEEEQVAV